jgi:hypothetical protein
MAKKTGNVYRCELYQAGHTVHFIQVNRSAGEPDRQGKLTEVAENVITIDFGDQIKRYRNHDPDRLVDIVGIGRTVRVCERYVILRGNGGYCFSIQDADEPWVPCDHEPLTSFTAEALAERVQTHGGFFVPGGAVELDEKPPPILQSLLRSASAMEGSRPALWSSHSRSAAVAQTSSSL